MIRRWRRCEDCLNAEGFDIFLITQEDFKECEYEEWGNKIEGSLKTIYKKDSEQPKDSKYCFISLKDFSEDIEFLIEDFIENGDLDGFGHKQREAIDKINWGRFGRKFIEHAVRNCPKKRVHKKIA